jgi:hypothetical protein
MYVNLAIFYGYVLCYCLTTAFLRMVALKHVPTVYLPVAALLLGVALGVGPFLLAFFITNFGDFRHDLTAYFLGSPVILNYMDREIGAIVAPLLIGWTLLGVVVSMRWFVGQWQRFTPYRAEEA